jgi:predicted aldo/keto reductase-like oxidoreductase
MSGVHRVDRRDFLRQGAAVAAAATVAPWTAGRAIAAGAAPSIQRYVKLGRTGLAISDISFGSSRTSDPDVVRHALERGSNYFDTAEDYQGGRAESAIGEAVAGKRDRVFLATKTKMEAGESRADIMRALEGSLRRLRTDHVDVYFNHAVNELARAQNPEWPEFVALAKRQGKIRWSGMSGHGGRLVECLDFALAHQLVDVILVAHNFGQDPAFYEKFRRGFDFVALQPDLPPLMKRAREAGVGVIAMKTLMGARLNDLRAYEHGGATFAQAAFRWVLASGHADALIVSMTGPEMIDEYVAASGQARNRASDLRLLEEYARLNGRTHCQHACRACEPSCPAGVTISEVLRTRMYAVDYGDPALARSEYAGVSRDASACLACADTPCLGACPIGIPIPSFTRDAARRLG